MLITSICCKVFFVARVICWKVTMCPVICVLGNQLLEWPGQYMEIMNDSWILTTDPTQVYCPYACFYCICVFDLVQGLGLCGSRYY